MKCYMHVNYLEWLDDIDQIARRCAEAGFDGVELRGYDRTNRRSLSDYLDHACDAAERNKLDLVFGCPNDTTNADVDARSQSMKKFETIIRCGGKRGVKILNVFAGVLSKPGTPSYYFDQHGSALYTDDQRRWTVDYFRKAGDLAGEFGIDLCFETHSHYPHDLPGTTATLIEEIDRPNVKVNLDYANMYLHAKGGSISDALARLGPHIGYVHLKNLISFTSFGVPLYRGISLRDGDINHEDFIHRLRKIGYVGPWAIENVCPGDKAHAMVDDQKYLRGLLANG